MFGAVVRSPLSAPDRNVSFTKITNLLYAIEINHFKIPLHVCLPQDPRIVGGSQANVTSWPWQAAVYTSYNYLICGGSILNERWVLTTANSVQY